MINAPQLLADLTKLLKRLEGDLRQRIEDLTALKASLQAEWQAARDAGRCAETFETWADQVITQAGVHWLLSCVFLRFIEDNQLVDRPWLGGTPESGRLALARDRHEAYFREYPTESDRDYLLSAFREAGTLPGLHTFFDEAHNPAFRLGISGDAAMALREFWQQVDPSTGALLHNFTDADWNTRFLGDLYQDLSEATRKRYALLQTPEFVEEFVLDRTLTPAIREFGFRDVRMIDPTCGSGHFLLGGFHRLLAEWQRNEPGGSPVDLAQKALDAVAGVDLNPFAVAISRFRLFVAALQAAGVQRLANAPDFSVSVAIGDSLLHGTRFGLTQSQDLFDVAESHADTGLAHAYASEDLGEVQRILGRQYHAVVGNPPYIVVKDAALNAAYRRKYASCHMKYSLGAPFTERFFELAVTGTDGRGAGYVGLITANSFMKREFGSKLIEQVLPRLDLTHVVDTSGAYIPGHGTPTVILFGRNRMPIDTNVRTVMGIKGEPSTPDDPAEGLVWGAILDQIDQVGSESEFVSVADTFRSTLGRHPWSIGGGGASALKELIEERCLTRLGDVTAEMGFFGITAADDVLLSDIFTLRRHLIEEFLIRPIVVGDEVRDWCTHPKSYAIFPYTDERLVDIHEAHYLGRWLWPFRTNLGSRPTFSKKTYFEEGRPWWEWHQVAVRRAKNLVITLAFVATDNHFVLEREGKVYKQSSPLIKLPDNSSVADYLNILQVLNSSAGCFWMKQVLHDKGNGGIGGGIASEDWERFYEYTSAGLKDFPVPENQNTEIAARLDALSLELSELSPREVLVGCSDTPRDSLMTARNRVEAIYKTMIGQQEELDWRCYRLYGLLPAGLAEDEVEFFAPVEVARGERAFEIVLARRVAAGLEQTTWFERHGSTPITEIPTHWPAGYRRVVARRIELIERDKSIGLIERPEFKRRWNSPRSEDLEASALRDWLLARLEAPALWPASPEQPPQLNSTSRLADAVSHDADFMQIAALYAGHADFDLPQLVAELVVAEAVPALPAQRYTDTGLRKRAQWQDTWTLQRREDAIEARVVAENDDTWRAKFAEMTRTTFGTDTSEEARAWIEKKLAEEIKRHQDERKASEVGAIPVPPKYQSKDFLKADFWRLRGGLDVPKERWISYPGCERGSDGSLVIAWAGWDHLQQATALAGYYLDMKDSEGWEPARLQPLLASLLELVPWLEQWHNELDPVFGERMGDYYRGFVTQEARDIGFTLDDLHAWKPPVVAARRGRRKAS
ncbi:hypothetical protein LMG23992_02276 [Cupriavidus laharis]|uniref:site-specific DNA-methyltransferase (adenine-specific) n=1 Tax=Cupriavidus laharis TaxID=151654 RepID=A0ABM8WYM4_9BURK|nr:BREX-2 system adenine-specific DNA-methyltransferase PglX [Cupriavidus laharis]CAG9172596.1 hypothetical protein LMG23992_02276 [Cupriavidus laharis]